MLFISPSSIRVGMKVKIRPSKEIYELEYMGMPGSPGGIDVNEDYVGVITITEITDKKKGYIWFKGTEVCTVSGRHTIGGKRWTFDSRWLYPHGADIGIGYKDGPTKHSEDFKLNS